MRLHGTSTSRQQSLCAPPPAHPPRRFASLTKILKPALKSITFTFPIVSCSVRYQMDSFSGGWPCDTKESLDHTPHSGKPVHVTNHSRVMAHGHETRNRWRSASAQHYSNKSKEVFLYNPKQLYECGAVYLFQSSKTHFLAVHCLYHILHLKISPLL